jgi:hypothetical protein
MKLIHREGVNDGYVTPDPDREIVLGALLPFDPVPAESSGALVAVYRDVEPLAALGADGNRTRTPDGEAGRGTGGNRGGLNGCGHLVIQVKEVEQIVDVTDKAILSDECRGKVVLQW